MNTQIQKVVITGANGFLGRYLSRHYLAKGWQVIAMARCGEGIVDGVEYCHWDGETVGSNWLNAIDGANLLVNFAGRSVNCRYHEANREQILSSRVESTQVLAKAIKCCSEPPVLWINSSTATIYRHAEDRAQDEDGELGEGFSVDVAQAWERAFFASEVPDSVRKVALRCALVMEDEPGTVWAVLSNLAKWGLGGTMGSGTQKVSWVAMDDFCRVVDHLQQQQIHHGVFNVSAPEVVDNRGLMKAVRDASGVRFGLPAARWMLKIGAVLMKTETELILKSRWVRSRKLEQSGFVFKYPRLEDFVEGLSRRE